MDHLKEIGLHPYNRVGIAPDADGVHHICYAGNHKQLALLSGLPGAQRWPEYDCLAFPLTRQNILVCETVGRVEEATDDYVAARNEFLKAPLEYAALYPPTPSGEPDPLKHQVDAFCWTMDSFNRGIKGFGMWAEMGTGKTRWACDLLRTITKRSAVIIVQNSTSHQWRGWLERICPDFQAHILTGMPLTKRAAIIRDVARGSLLDDRPAIFVVNWEAIYRLQEMFIELQPDLVVADEATRAKCRTTQIAKALHRIGAAARYRVAMSGSPIGNDPGDLWSIYRFIEPTLFGKSYWNFVRQFFVLGGFTGNEFVSFNPLQVGSFVNRMYASAFRITKSCIGDLPEKTFETVSLDMGPKQAELYKQAERDLYVKWFDEEGRPRSLSIANALVLVTRLQQIAAGLLPIQNEDGETTHCELIESAKTTWLQEYCKETLAESDIQVVVWARFTKEIERICQALTDIGLTLDVDFGYISGSVKMKDRENLRLAFNDRENPMRVLVCQTAAAAYGLDLPSADCLVFHTNSFSHLERVQALERGHRIGRKRAYTVIDLVCKGTIDKKVLSALQKKADLADTLLVDGF